MKIGVLTYWSVPNYGAWMQAYALNNVLRCMFPEYEIEHIAYLEESHWNSYYEHDQIGYNNFNYNWDEIPHSNPIKGQDISEYECDVLVTGSDSIWEEINSGVFNFDGHLVGLGFKKISRIISYAPSSGVVNKSSNIPSEMRIGLESYCRISVRDESTQELVNSLIGVKPSVVLDPSLLWDFKNDENVKKPVYNHYIAVYGCNWNEDFIVKARNFADDNGYLLVSIGFINDWCDVNFKRLELRTFEWLGMIKYSDYVFSSTFHGLMMGVSFEKQVKFCQVEYVKNRSKTLIEKLNLTNSIFSFENTINYAEVNPILDCLREQSLSWLREAIME